MKTKASAKASSADNAHVSIAASALIDGEQRSSGQTREIRDPYRSDVVGTMDISSKADVGDALEAAVQARDSAAGMPGYERAALLRRISQLIERDAESLAQLMTRETGKAITDAGAEIRRSLETFDRLTRTIVQQVDAMKAMVNAFSNYARTPKMQPRRVDLNDLVSDVVELYRNDPRAQRVDTDLARDLPALEADPDRLRQILHNLEEILLHQLAGALQQQWNRTSGFILLVVCANMVQHTNHVLSVIDSFHWFAPFAPDFFNGPPRGWCSGRRWPARAAYG